MKKIGNGSWARTKVVHGDNIFAEEGLALVPQSHGVVNNLLKQHSVLPTVVQQKSTLIWPID